MGAPGTAYRRVGFDTGNDRSEPGKGAPGPAHRLRQLCRDRDAAGSRSQGSRVAARRRRSFPRAPGVAGRQHGGRDRLAPHHPLAARALRIAATPLFREILMKLHLAGAVALLVLAACGRAADVSDAEVAARAHAYLQAHAAAGTFNGTALVARGPRTLFVKGYGLANEESGARNGEATRFPTASITKTFTAALVMKLRREGRLALEDPVCRHLVPCASHWQPVTLRHLLTHTAGIPDYARAADFPKKMHERRSTEQLIAEFSGRPLEFTP